MLGYSEVFYEFSEEWRALSPLLKTRAEAY
jgi:hypothetical protein